MLQVFSSQAVWYLLCWRHKKQLEQQQPEAAAAAGEGRQATGGGLYPNGNFQAHLPQLRPGTQHQMVEEGGAREGIIREGPEEASETLSDLDRMYREQTKQPAVLHRMLKCKRGSGQQVVVFNPLTQALRQVREEGDGGMQMNE